MYRRSGMADSRKKKKKASPGPATDSETASPATGASQASGSAVDAASVGVGAPAVRQQALDLPGEEREAGMPEGVQNCKSLRRDVF